MNVCVCVYLSGQCAMFFVCPRLRILLRRVRRVSRGRANSMVRADNVVMLLLFLVRPLLGHRPCVCCLGTLTVGWNGVSRAVGRVIDWVSWDVGWVLPYTPHGLWVGRRAGLSRAVGLVPLPPHPTTVLSRWTDDRMG